MLSIGFDFLIKLASFFAPFWCRFGTPSGPNLETKFDQKFTPNFDRFLTPFGSHLGPFLRTFKAPFSLLGASGGHLGTTLTSKAVPRPSWDQKMEHFRSRLRYFGPNLPPISIHVWNFLSKYNHKGQVK